MKILLFAISCLFILSSCQKSNPKVYWFIPDGMRADGELFDVYKWAEEGELPNIKKMINEGSYGYSIPDFPSHTPTNFASLLTGARPATHGIADGPMHIEGYPLQKPSAPGFSSTTKKVSPIWKIVDSSKVDTVLLSIPGSTPPEISKTVIRGRWGGWGFDSHSVVFESEGLLPLRKNVGRGHRLFFLGSQLTSFVPFQKEGDVFKSVLKAHGSEIQIQHDPLSKQVIVNNIKVGLGKWSDWIPIVLSFKGEQIQSRYKLKFIKSWDDGNFRIKVLFDLINKFSVEPPERAEELSMNVGPMVDYPDNWPPQLVREEEDRETFFEETMMALDWHAKAANYIFKQWKPGLFIHDTYTPNQMLESRWWHKRLVEGSSEEKSEAMKDIKSMYKGLDKIIGEVMKNADHNTTIVLSSDHGVCHLKRLVYLNNIFAKKGWLKYSIDEKTGEAQINWDQTKVVYLKMNHIYVNPKGLGGNWNRASGKDYDQLREQVMTLLKNLRDEDGTAPLANAVKWEDAEKTYHLPADRVGDIVIEARLGHFWYEEVNKERTEFSNPVTSGYKQSIDARSNRCMWTPFAIWGPKVKKGFKLDAPIDHIDQLPTILTIMEEKIPTSVEGKVLKQILK
ncbi:MAG: hypothetical protein Fur0010_11110 [Bdellovibrio sp.]